MLARLQRILWKSKRAKKVCKKMLHCKASMQKNAILQSKNAKNVTFRNQDTCKARMQKFGFQ